MFTALFSPSKNAPEDPAVLTNANKALKQRMEHMLRQTHLIPRIERLEAKPGPVVKAPLSIRKAIAA